jgi:hypothetical protein
LRSQPWGGAVNCNKAEKLEADLRPGGFEVVNEPGTPAYHQLTTSAYGQKALDFYRQVFGWQTETSPIPTNSATAQS